MDFAVEFAAGSATMPLAGKAAAAINLKIAPYLKAARHVPKSRADFHVELRSQGFQHQGTTSGGYVRYVRPDGSQVWIRPNGEVIRLGPKVTPSGGGKPYNPRIDASGNRIDTHSPGEFVVPLSG